jgi:hypothetical protein
VLTVPPLADELPPVEGLPPVEVIPPVLVLPPLPDWTPPVLELLPPVPGSGPTFSGAQARAKQVANTLSHSILMVPEVLDSTQIACMLTLSVAAGSSV